MASLLTRPLYMRPVLLAGLFLLAGMGLFSGCDSKSKPKTNWMLDLRSTSKNPYSLFLTYESLPVLFPGAQREKIKADYHLANLGYQFRKNKGVSMLLMIGSETRFSTAEVDSLLSFVEAGNQILLSSNRFDEALLERLKLRQTFYSSTAGNATQQIFLKDKNETFASFPYRFRDRAIHGNFESSDTINAPFYTLGTNQDKQPDCILFSIGKGKLFLHAAPMAFSNYFLLQQDNKEYLNNLFRYIPENLSNIYFCSYNYRDVSDSSFGKLLSYKSILGAFLLALLGLLIFVLFEMKRRQKVIPILAPVENSSVAFVETIGRLYYNKKDHANLSEKMVQHFLDFVRQNYYLNTNQLDEEFVRHLAAKSGVGIPKTDTLVHMIKEVQQGVKADEAFLYSLYNQLQPFYHGK